MNPSLHQ